jgi:hypothetical protein
MLDLTQLLRQMVFLCLLALTFAASDSQAQQTIHVPADQPTIQAGINAASDGDTVLVAPGTYVENIDFKGKAITVTSSDGPANTIVDGRNSDIVVRFVTNETRSSVLNGFTIKNAGVSQYPNNSTSDYFDGILIAYTTTSSVANPTITNNIITQNHGYGIEIHFGGAWISGNTISYTSTQYDPKQDFGCDYDDGDGIYVGGTPNDTSVTTVISGNIIEYNVGHCLGGGIGLYAAGSPLVTNNIIRYNTSLGQGGGIYMVNGNSLSVVQNLIYGNTAGAAAGGIYLGNSSQNLSIVNNTIVGNAIIPNPLLADYYQDGSQITFGGAVTGTVFFNNIIVGADHYGAISCNPTYQYLSSTPLVVNNSDIVNFSAPTFSGWCTAPPTIASAMISADPGFVTVNDEPFHLQSGSPLLDAGSVSLPNLPSQDLDANPRTNGGKVDMGVYEGGASAPVNPPARDFSMALAPTSLALQSGQSGTAVVTITPAGGFIGNVSFACSGLPGSSYCTFSPSMLAAGGDGSTLTSTVTMYASTAAAQIHVRGSRGPAVSVTAFSLICVAFLCMALLRCAHNSRFCWSLEFMVLLMVVAGMGSCGGGGGSPSIPPPPLPPSPLLASVVITASGTGNAITGPHAVTLNVTITP